MRSVLVLLLLSGCDEVFGGDWIDPMTGDSSIRPQDVDNDGVLHSDDNCPHRANMDQSDRDEDLIGDACDPDQTQAVDEVVSIDLFDGATNAWMVTSAWQQDADGLTSPPLPSQSALSYQTQVELFAPTLQIGFEIVDRGSPGMGNELRVEMNGQDSPGHCAIVEDSFDDGRSTIETRWKTGELAPEITAATPYHLWCSRGARAAWSIQGQSDAADDDVNYETPMQLRLVVTQMRLRLRYVALYSQNAQM